MREYIIQLTDKMLEKLGLSKDRAKKHELTRCRNCRNYADHRCILTNFRCRDRDYCSWSERKDNG